MITNITTKQQASLDRAWTKRLAAGDAVKSAKAAYQSHAGDRHENAESFGLYRAWKHAEMLERRARGVWFRLDYLYRYKPELP